MDKLTIIMFLGLSFFMFYLFYFMLKREKELETKFLAIERGLDDLSKEIFEIKKKLKTLKKDDNTSLIELEKVIEELVDNIKNLEKNHILKIKELEESIISLRKNLKKVNFANISGNDEQKIIALYKNGYSIEDISKELRIPAGEVEFVVKMMKNI